MTDPEAIVRAREILAARYPGAAVVQAGILGGQWDGGSLMREAVEEAERELIRERKEVDPE